MKCAAHQTKTQSACLAAAMLGVFLAANAPVLAADKSVAKPGEATSVSTYTTESAPPVSVVVNKSTILRLDVPATRISVANPAVADITPINPREIYVLGKTVGSTNLIVWNKNGAAIMMDIHVTPEPVMAAPAPAPVNKESVEVIKGLNKSQMEF